MTKIKKLTTTSLAVVFLAGSLGLAGCGVSEEQMAELNALRNEVSSLATEVNTLKSDKTKLEREIAEMEAKLDQCAKDKAATTKNLQSLGL